MGRIPFLDRKLCNLKRKKIPRGLVILEIVFDNQDRSKVEDKGPNTEDLEEVNLGTREAPKNVYIGRKMSPKIRHDLIGLLRKYRHAFAWSYDDLKAYREDLFQHEIPLKPNAKPFRGKMTNKSHPCTQDVGRIDEIKRCRNYKAN